MPGRYCSGALAASSSALVSYCSSSSLWPPIFLSFDDLLGISGARFASWFTYGVSGALWLQMNMKRTVWRIAPSGSWTWRNAPLFLVNLKNILVGLTMVRISHFLSSQILNLLTAIWVGSVSLASMLRAKALQSIPSRASHSPAQIIQLRRLFENTNKED